LQTLLLPIILPHGVGVGKINLSKTTFLSLFLAVGFMVGMSFSSVYAGIPWDTSEIANDAITSAKILNKQVNSPDIHFAAVKSNKIKDGTIISADIAADAVTGEKIAGTSKLLFRECSATFTNVAPMRFGEATCQLPGSASGDNVIITDTDKIANCMIFGGLSSSLLPLLQIRAFNGCINTVTQTADYDVIIFRVN